LACLDDHAWIDEVLDEADIIDDVGDEAGIGLVGVDVRVLQMFFTGGVIKLGLIGYDDRILA
jgi:hypothetical protein